MTIYTSDPGPGINQPISNVPSGLGESLSASFESGFRAGPSVSAVRFSEAEDLATDPNSKVVAKDEADAKLKSLGIKSINIPDTGVTQAYLEHVTESRLEELAKQQIAQSAPSGFINTPLNFMAGLAGSMADPANLAIGLIPFAGEARAATLLGRAGERFVQGATMGATLTAATIPFTASAAAAEGEDYTMALAMENLFYGTVGGGILYAGGGVIADVVRARRAASAARSPLTEEGGPVTAAAPTFRDVIPEERNVSAVLLNDAIERNLDNYAYSTAYNDVIPEFRAQQEVQVSNIVGNVADLRAELSANTRALQQVDATLPERTRQYQSERMKFRDARARALRDVEADKGSIQARQDEIQQTLDSHAAGERARGDIAELNRSGIPERAKALIEERAQGIRQGLQQTPLAAGIRTAEQRINDAHWTVRQQSFRAAISHALQGRTPDIEHFFDLENPQMRQDAWREISNGPRSDVEPSTIAASQSAEVQYRRLQQESSELQSAQTEFNAELELARSLTNDIDVPELRDALAAATREASDDSIFNGLRAYATCVLRRI